MAKGCESLQFRNVREGFGGKGIGFTWRQFLRNKEVVVFLVREFRWKIGGFVCLVKEKRQERFMFYKEKEIERREKRKCVCVIWNLSYSGGFLAMGMRRKKEDEEE